MTASDTETLLAVFFGQCYRMAEQENIANGNHWPWVVSEKARCLYAFCQVNEYDAVNYA